MIDLLIKRTQKISWGYNLLYRILTRYFLLVKTLTNVARMHTTVTEMLLVTTTWGFMVALAIEDIPEEDDRVPVRSCWVLFRMSDQLAFAFIYFCLEIKKQWRTGVCSCGFC